jgi:hypothetical protein
MTIVRTEFRIFLMEKKDERDMVRMILSLQRNLKAGEVVCVHLTVEERPNDSLLVQDKTVFDS